MNTQEALQMQGFDSLIEALSERVAEKVCERIGNAEQGKEEGLMTRQETLDYLHITDATLWRWVTQGLLVPAGKIGSRIYFSKSNVEAALKRKNEGKTKSE